MELQDEVIGQAGRKAGTFLQGASEAALMLQYRRARKANAEGLAKDVSAQMAERARDQEQTVKGAAEKASREANARLYNTALTDDFWKWAQPKEAAEVWRAAQHSESDDPRAEVARQRVEREASSRWGINIGEAAAEDFDRLPSAFGPYSEEDLNQAELLEAQAQLYAHESVESREMEEAAAANYEAATDADDIFGSTAYAEYEQHVAEAEVSDVPPAQARTDTARSSLESLKGKVSEEAFISRQTVEAGRMNNEVKRTARPVQMRLLPARERRSLKIQEDTL